MYFVEHCLCNLKPPEYILLHAYIKYVLQFKDATTWAFVTEKLYIFREMSVLFRVRTNLPVKLLLRNFVILKV